MKRLLHIFLIILLVTLLTSCSGGGSTAAPGVSFTVMTYNIHHGEGTDGVLDLARIAGIIDSANCDIIGLQEVDNNFGRRSQFVDQAKWLAEKLDMHYAYAPAIDNQANEKPQQYGDAILSRYPIINKKVHKLPVPTGYEPKVCLEAKVKIGGRDYTFMVTHLDHISNEVRSWQAAEILKVALSPLKRTVLVGDFNCQPPDATRDPKTTEPVARILEKFEDTFVLSKASYQESFEGEGRIDYIFVSGDLSGNVSSNVVIVNDITAVASDHFPLVAEIRE